jgi:hypothetical protein
MSEKKEKKKKDEWIEEAGYFFAFEDIPIL